MGCCKRKQVALPANAAVDTSSQANHCQLNGTNVSAPNTVFGSVKGTEPGCTGDTVSESLVIDSEGASNVFVRQQQEHRMLKLALSLPEPPGSILPEKLRVAAAGALVACQACLDVGDIIGAEAAIMDELGRLEASSLDGPNAHAAIEFLRASEQYSATLGFLRDMGKLAEEVLENDPSEGKWTLGADVKCDYASLGIPIDEVTQKVLLQHPDTSSIKIYYRLNGKHMDVKIDCLLPTQTPSSLPCVAGLVAMYHETGLWNVWHPILVGKGPLELWRRRPFHNLWQVPTKVFMQTYVEMVEERMFFVRDTGVFLMSLDGKASHHEFWTRYPPHNSSWKILPGRNTFRAVSVTQKRTTATSIVSSFEGDIALPEFLVKFVVSWLLPEIVRRMLRAGAQCLSHGGPHGPAVQADADGIYARCKELATRGAELDEANGRKAFSSGNMPTADVVKGRARNMLSFEESFAARGSPDWARLAAGPELTPSILGPPLTKTAVDDDRVPELDVAQSTTPMWTETALIGTGSDDILFADDLVMDEFANPCRCGCGTAASS